MTDHHIPEDQSPPQTCLLCVSQTWTEPHSDWLSYWNFIVTGYDINNKLDSPVLFRHMDKEGFIYSCQQFKESFLCFIQNNLVICTEVKYDN